MNYMIKRDGQESGPYSVDQMRQMRSAGQIDEAVLFRRYGTTDWLAAVDLEEELADVGAVVPPQLPAVVAAPQGTAMQPVVMKRLDIPFSDIFVVVLKTMIALLLASPILVVIALLVMLAVSILGAVLLVGAK